MNPTGAPESVLDHLPEVYYRLRLGDAPRLEMLTRRFAELTGHECAPYLVEGGRSLIELVHPSDRARVLQEYEAAARDLRAYVVHYRITRADGTVRHVCERGSVTAGESGTLVRHGALFDESERLWAEREIHDHSESLHRKTRDQDRLVALLEVINEVAQAVLLARTEAEIFPIIARALVEGTGAPFAAVYLVRDGTDRHLLGYEEMSSAGDAAGGEGQPAKWQSIAEGLVGHAIREAETCVACGEDVPGSEEWRERHGLRAAMVFPLIFQEGAAGALMVLDEDAYPADLLRGFDLLARKAVAAVLSARRAEQLEQETARRRELIARLERVNGELVVASAAAEQASQMKSRFLANVSHEIRTPLNGILGMAELLAVSDMTGEQAESVHALRSCADSLLLLLNDILDLSKIEAGKLELEEMPFSLVEVIDGTLGTVAIRAQEKGLELEAVVSPTIPDRLVGDPARLRQVLTNLVGNAIKFTGRGRVTLSARSIVAGDASQMVQLDVVDTGCGIRQDRLAAIFEPFIQADSSTTREFGGTGLGLAICKQLTELMGGSIEAGSELGRGSRFTVRIPLRPAAGVPSGDAVPASEALENLQAVVFGPYALATDALTSHLSRLGVSYHVVSDRDELDDVLTVAADGRVVVFHQVSGPDDAAEEDARRTLKRAWERGVDAVLVAGLGQRDLCERLRNENEARILGRPIRWGSVSRTLRRIVDEEEPTRPQPKRHANVEGVRVLLAEDHPINQKLATRMLEKAGCHVTVVANGQEALDALDGGCFDLVLMDMQMPVLDGVETTRLLRKRGGLGGEIPIVALTANAMKGDREACLSAGMDGYLTKPFRYDQLLTTIEEWRYGRKAKDDAPLVEA